LCLEENIGLLPWSPLAGGRLAGSRDAGTRRATSNAITGGKGWFARPEDQVVIDTLRSLSKERGEAPAQVAIAWLLSKPGVTAPIVGATKLHQLDDPIRAVETMLSTDEIKRLEASYVTQPVIGLSNAQDSASMLGMVRFGRPSA
jgi:aryl-alcohol dehydrogenase-like predicted oxidoreductase